MYWGCEGEGGGYGYGCAGVVGCVVCDDAGFAVKVMRSGGCAYWKPLPPPVDGVLARPACDVEAGAAVYAKGEYWTLPGWAYATPGAHFDCACCAYGRWSGGRSE